MSVSRRVPATSGFDEDAIPPVIRILLDETLPNATDAPGLVRKLKRLVSPSGMVETPRL
jgi:hypothetical protein